MRYLLDTDICIYVIKRKPERVLARLLRTSRGDVGISAITLSELQYGVERSDRREQNRMALGAFIGPLEVLPYDRSVADHYGKIRAEWDMVGKPVGALDLLIAAHALTRGLVLVTNNEREFRRVPSLKVENWAVET
jgi:tRNA(fMet)-specific endonuclease VapC